MQYHQPGVAKRFDPRAKFATAWPDTVRFTWQAAANAVALLSTVGNAVLEKCARYLPGQIKLFGGPDEARGP